MTIKQKMKLLIPLAMVSYAVQFALLRPGENAMTALLLGAISLAVSVAFLALIEWVAKP